MEEQLLIVNSIETNESQPVELRSMVEYIPEAVQLMPVNGHVYEEQALTEVDDDVVD